jgi:D-beta-D-heptose 7-phosphate kinase/D-beta-D-heptose 1-phosphate adenosyltransferase
MSNMHSTERKIVHDHAVLKAKCDAHRAANKRLVFTNGVFDLLHLGHLDSLRRAAAEGDVLVVGVNSDAGVQRLKGPGRPILPANQRMRILAAIDVVDLVVPFDEDTPEGLIRLVTPHVLVKGAHYTVEQLAGHDYVTAHGGQVKLMPIMPSRSTTNVVDEIIRRFVDPTRAV